MSNKNESKSNELLNDIKRNGILSAEQAVINSLADKGLANRQLTPIQKIDFWTKDQYEISFQFWGDGNNNVFINREGVEIASFGGRNSIDEIINDTILWCEKSNPGKKY